MQLGGIAETAAYKFVPRLADQSLHLRGFVRVIRAFHKNEARLAEPGGLVEFEVSGRETLSVLPSVFLAEKANVEVATRDLVEINGIGAAIGGGNVALKDEGVEKSP